MSTFYLLPPRPLLGERFAGYLRTLFPGLDWGTASWAALADVLGATVACHDDVYVIYRDDLPPGEEAGRALADAFGAEPGDEVIEVRAGIRSDELATRRWHLKAS